MPKNVTKTKKSGDIGFTFEEVGTKILPNGQTVPRFNGKPNDPEAHRKFIEWIQSHENGDQ